MYLSLCIAIFEVEQDHTYFVVPEGSAFAVWVHNDIYGNDSSSVDNSKNSAQAGAQLVGIVIAEPLGPPAALYWKQRATINDLSGQLYAVQLQQRNLRALASLTAAQFTELTKLNDEESRIRVALRKYGEDPADINADQNPAFQGLPPRSLLQKGVQYEKEWVQARINFRLNSLNSIHTLYYRFYHVFTDGTVPEHLRPEDTLHYQITQDPIADPNYEEHIALGEKAIGATVQLALIFVPGGGEVGELGAGNESLIANSASNDFREVVQIAGADGKPIQLVVEVPAGPTAATSEFVYRIVSTKEFAAIRANGGLIIRPLGSSELGITLNPEYAAGLTARNASKYAVNVQFEVTPGTFDELISRGAVHPSAVSRFPDLPVFKRGMTVPQIKIERGGVVSILLGNSPESVKYFNARIIVIGNK